MGAMAIVTSAIIVGGAAHANILTIRRQAKMARPIDGSSIDFR